MLSEAKHLITQILKKDFSNDKILESKQDISCMTTARFQILKTISHCSKNVLKGVWVVLID
ncbi:hypothetical protein [Helicobacter bilis]|uniref:Uncharacterized protein n=1 Tax=Helicobacter bilis TaxID=37372 RepID=A0A4U8U923_9HELI|nr:hypothetical protein [Helicobacter bilis]TLE10580.1 hypothetical protein LS79_005465 [Helicobacter bilis]